jgi:hypothetical protein
VQSLAGGLSSKLVATGLFGDTYRSLCLIMAVSTVAALVFAVISYRRR